MVKNWTDTTKTAVEPRALLEVPLKPSKLDLTDQAFHLFVMFWRRGKVVFVVFVVIVVVVVIIQIRATSRSEHGH